MGIVWSIFGEEMVHGYTDPNEQTGSDDETDLGGSHDVELLG